MFLLKLCCHDESCLVPAMVSPSPLSSSQVPQSSPTCYWQLGNLTIHSHASWSPCFSKNLVS